MITNLSPRIIGERDISERLYRFKSVVEDSLEIRSDGNSSSLSSLKIRIPKCHPDWNIDFTTSYDPELVEGLLSQFEVDEAKGLNEKAVEAYVLNYHLLAVEPANTSLKCLEEDSKNPVTIIYPSGKLYKEFFKLRTKISEVEWYKPDRKLSSTDLLKLSIPMFEPPSGYRAPARSIYYYRGDVEQLLTQFNVTNECQLKGRSVRAYFIGGSFFGNHFVGIEPCK